MVEAELVKRAKLLKRVKERRTLVVVFIIWTFGFLSVVGAFFRKDLRPVPMVSYLMVLVGAVYGHIQNKLDALVELLDEQRLLGKPS